MSSSLGTWSPAVTLLPKGSEDTGMNDVVIQFTPLGVPNITTGMIETPSITKYSVVINDELKKYLTPVINGTSNVTLTNPAKNFIGIFPISIFYTDIKTDTTNHKVTNWEDLPKGNNIKIYNYVAPNPTIKIFLIDVTVTLSNNKSATETYELHVETNLDKNRNAFLKALKERE